MKIIYSAIIFLIILVDLNAQQLPLHSIYREQWGILNPAAYSNNYRDFNLTRTAALSYRQQFISLGSSSDVPNTQIANLEWWWEDMNSIIGGHIVRDQTGLLSQTGVYGRYAYQIKLGGFYIPHVITVGLNAGIVRFQSNIDGSSFEIAEPDIVPFSDYYLDFNVGIHYQYKKVFYAGISVPQLLGPSATLDDTERDFSLKQQQHFYGVAGFYIPMDLFGTGDNSSYLEPSAWVKYTAGVNVHFDVNVRYVSGKLFWFGIGGSSAYIGRVETGLFIGEKLGLANSQLKIGLAYDQPVLKPIVQLGPGFEVNVSYSWF